MTDMTRRSALALVGGAAALSACAKGQAEGEPVTFGTETAPLKDLAAEKGIRFGTAMAAYQVDDPQYVEIVKRDCGYIVAENEHKWYTIHPQPDVMNFAPADKLVDFAKSNGIGMRGHAVVWHHPRWLPDWVNNTTFSSSAEAEAKLGQYVTDVVSRYDPFLYSWDVINESVADEDGSYRETSFSRAMGGTVNTIDFCFRKSREAAPNCKLAYNDYMSWETTSTKHRAGVLRLLEELKKKGTPIDALGIQSHSNYEMPDEYTPEKVREWRAFVEEAIGMGLEIYLTEFDVNDTRMTPDKAIRDQAIASYTRDYLDLMFSYNETKEVLMWGMVDKYSWLQGFLPREDGVEKRPTLYDSDYRPKLMRDAVAAALKSAPVRV